MKCRALNVYHNLSKMLILPDIKNGSSVKCVDTFRIAFTEESKVFIEQKEGYAVFPVCYIYLLIQKPFSFDISNILQIRC